MISNDYSQLQNIIKAYKYINANNENAIGVAILPGDDMEIGICYLFNKYIQNTGSSYLVVTHRLLWKFTNSNRGW